MARLTNADIEWLTFTCAKKDGEKPSLTFKINNEATVAAFLHAPENANLFDIDIAKNKNAKRLEWAIKDDILTISRFVRPTTLAFASNQTLARDVLLHIYEADLSIGPDLYIGLANLEIPEDIYNSFEQEAPTQTTVPI